MLTALTSRSDLFRCLMEAQHRVSAGHPHVLASFSLPWAQADHFDISAANRLHEQPITLRSIPGRDLSLLGLGCAHGFHAEPGSSWAGMQEQWQHVVRTSVIHGGHRPMLCGGFAFDRTGPRRSRWQDFPETALTLARFCLARRNGETRLIINTLVAATSDCTALTEAIVADWAMIMSRRPPMHRIASLPALLEHDIAAAAWKLKVAAAVATIRAGILEKVVQARTRTVPLTVPVEDVLSTLRGTHPDAYLFALARNDSCFLGASPERLVKFGDRRLSTCALAGSAPRSNLAAEDARLGSDLLHSAKDRHEHALVVNELRSVLARCCTQMEVSDQPRLRKLTHVQHLMTLIEGEANDNVQLLALLEQLHPSPAVGGLPRADAIAYIRTQEDLDRGWYAGPVGWIDNQGEGEFAVALRSALLRHGQATLFAGCGLVAGSSPDDEYRETDVKMRTMASALNDRARMSWLYG